ncbi:NAD(P)-binding protein [Aliamphritea spongicola]|nr:NAD(P)-binding protein [Aliamphritea spongicola]
MSDSYDFAIIGAGLAGSFCASLLRTDYPKLCVLEKAAAAAADSAADVTKA